MQWRINNEYARLDFGILAAIHRPVGPRTASPHILPNPEGSSL
jgi:hypothetical protein